MTDRKIITTTRLDLIALDREELGCFLDREDVFKRKVGPASRVILTPLLRKAILMKLSKMEQASPGDIPWITYWLIKVLPDGFGAGLIGFKGLPDQAGEVEIGYGIDPEYRNFGYITEAVQGLLKWAFADPRCRRITAPQTRRSNLASNRVLEKVGLRVYAESPDSISWCMEREDQNSKT